MNSQNQFDNFSDVNSETYRTQCGSLTEAQIGLLRAIANGEPQLSSAETIRKYRLRSSAAVNKNRLSLRNSDLIDNSSKEGWAFLDPIFKAWFRQNYL
ncbi:MAG: hypothetical protein LUD17_07245 [Bacteroidales bacterium]|nr:hypothetical protein [Bacteroidales bacterium]